MDWLPWQKRLLNALWTTPTVLLSTPRGGGKSTLAAHVLAECMTPGSRWHRHDVEHVIVAGAVAQARRTTWSILRPLLREMRGVRVYDTAQSCSAVHVESGARVSVMASNSDRALGLRDGLVVGDEPASWPGGEELFDALVSSLGKVGAKMRLFLCGTQAPATDAHWWPMLCASGDTRLRRVFLYQTDVDHWSLASELRKANPLLWSDPIQSLAGCCSPSATKPS